MYWVLGFAVLALWDIGINLLKVIDRRNQLELTGKLQEEVVDG